MKNKPERGPMELLELAAAAFEDGRDPFSTSWLSENNVTSDECYQLSQNIANACKNWARLAPEELTEGAVRVAVDDPSERKMLLANFRRSHSMSHTIKALGELAKK